MKEETREDLLSVIVVLEALSFEKGLTDEEKDAIYSIYGHARRTVNELFDAEADPEKYV